MKTFLLSACMILAFSASAQTTKSGKDTLGGGYITLKVIQTTSDALSMIYVTYPDGTVETQDLNRLKMLRADKEDFFESSKKIVKMFNKYRKQGYKVIEMSASISNGGIYEVYLLEK